MLVRTGDEQLRIETGDLLLDHTNRGQIDDYMTLLAQGRMVAGLGCSDSHDTKKIEAGKARTYVMSSTDDPRFLDVDEIITNMKAGRVIASTGPFVEAWVNDRPIGSRLHAGDGTLDVRIRAQAPPWMSLDRLEIYANGMLIGEIGEDASDHFLGCETDGLTIDGPDQVVRFNRPVSCHIARDAFINVVAIGYEGMGPVVNPIEGPSVEITDTLLLGVSDLLSKWLGLNIGNIIPVSGEFARNHEIYPYAFTNAIWVDVDGTDADGDGYDYDGPGYIPGWFDEDDAPAKSLEVLSSTTNQAAILAAKVRTRSLTSGLYMPTGSEAPPDFADDPADWDDDPFFFSCGS
ncbi:MAG: hypothetical protein M5R36_01280 [Deltaproteobacteria bacterium]|nr:hypothetical protein [Deltaproteobacteria bacterium]